ncbi:hypothetical protein [Acetivibrio saccincola]|uniref:Uncharacterized protein n=1 Tax=Acetivibrio saccincola TaxID=1677857 RepID=A0A2K9E3B3_9FIRM|nr:hypothetical protein [Acetivibrio saccincola]AUG58217.1 hypothetical protein HVS_11630 [Acetivibrio saccincola]
MEIIIIFLFLCFTVKFIAFLMAPNISKTKFIRKANNVDVSEVQGYKHKMSAVPYLNRLPEVIFCIESDNSLCAP